MVGAESRKNAMPELDGLRLGGANMELAPATGAGRRCAPPAAPADKPDLARKESSPPPFNMPGMLPTLVWAAVFNPPVDAAALPASFFFGSLRSRSVKCPCALGPSQGGAPAAASNLGDRYISCTRWVDTSD